jgi:four helix bundle protein
LKAVAVSQPEQLRDRTKAFALRVIRLYRSLPYKTDAQVLGKQLLRCGTSVAANYREVCRARSKAEFVAKIGVVVEEADEVVLWLELMAESGIVPLAKTEDLLKEANELTAIYAASQRTARQAS